MEGKKGFVITIIVLVVIILAAGTYIAFDIIQDKKQAEKKTSIVDENEIDLNAFYHVSYILDSFDKAFNNPKSNYLGYIYVSKRLKAEKFSMGAAIYASMIQDMTVSGPPVPYNVPESKVKYNFNRIFGKNLTYKVDQVESGEVYKVAYYNREDPPVRYDYYAPIEENVYSEKYIAINYRTQIDDDNRIIVDRRIFYAVFIPAADGKNYQSVTIYKDHNKDKKIATFELRNGYLNENEILSNAGSKLMKYRYIFVPGKGNNYNFYSIEVIK